MKGLTMKPNSLASAMATAAMAFGVCCVAPGTLAQPSDAAVKRAAEAAEAQDAAIKATQDQAAIKKRESEVRKHLRMPTAQDLAAQQGAFRLPAPASQAQRLDLEAIARSYDTQSGVPRQEQSDGQEREPVAGLLVFVSLGMPEASLQRLVEDAKRFRATLVLQGFKDKSLMAITEAIQRLQGEGVSLPWRVDPRLFDAFDVKAVPVHLLVDPQRPLQGGCPADECLAAARFSKLSGDVSMEYALRAIAAEDRDMAELANRMLSMKDDGQWYRRRSQP